MPANDDFLLYVLSANTPLDYGDFRSSFDGLYLRRPEVSSESQDRLGYQRNRTLRILDSLGHCDIEFKEGSSKIYVAPPVLARLPILGPPQVVLCGSRSLQTLAELKAARKQLGRQFEIEVYNQEARSPCIPARIGIIAESEQVLNDLARVLDICYASSPPAWYLVQASASINEYLETLDWTPGSEINWRRRDYDTSRLRFWFFEKSLTGTHLSSYESPITGLNNHYLWHDGQRAQADLYWARYAVLCAEEKNVILYDATRWLLAVPSGAPLPRLLARAVALCSGYAPHVADKSQVPIESPEIIAFDLYSAVSPRIAEAVASKLGQSLVPAVLDQWRG